MIENVPVIAAIVAIVGLFVALMLYRRNDAIEIDNEKVAEITEEIQKGAMAFLLSLIHI